MALRVPQYKIAPAGGEYSVTLVSGALTGVAAAGPVYSLRWTNTGLVCLVKRVQIFWVITTVFTTAQNVGFGLYFARAYSAVDSGGTAATLTGNNGKLDTNHPTTLMADMRISTTGVITAGTRTLDTQPLAAKAGGVNTLGQGPADLWPMDFGESDSRLPIIVRAQEGLVVGNLVTMGAAGVVTLYVTVQWTEVLANLVI